MTRNLDLALLRAFVAVADRASMTAAANVLCLTQGAVSQQIKRLEDLFGHPLFHRDRRGLRLTGAGERLLGKARRLLELNDDVWAEMSGISMRGAVRLGVPYDLMGNWLAPILKTYSQACPQVELSLRCGASPDLLQALDQGEVDLAIVEERWEPAAPPGARAPHLYPMNDRFGGAAPGRHECLSIERLVWVGAKGGRAHLRDPVPLSLVAETCAFRPAVLDALREQGRAWRTVFENGGIEATTATVQTDLAVTAWLASAVPAGLEILPDDAGLPGLPPFAITLHLGRHDSRGAVGELAQHIRQRLARPLQVA